jgi:hypothetical protein
MAQLQLPDLATRLQGLAVAPDRPRWVYASLANLRRGAPRGHVAHPNVASLRNAATSGGS